MIVDMRDPSTLGQRLLAEAACARAVYGKGKPLSLSEVYDSGAEWTGHNGHDHRELFVTEGTSIANKEGVASSN